MRTRADILAEVYAPEFFPGEFVRINVDIARIARLGIILRVTRIPFDDEFIFAVAVQVPRAHIARSVCAGGLVRHRELRRSVESQRPVRERLPARSVRDRPVERHHQRGFRTFRAIRHGSDFVDARRFPRCVEEIRRVLRADRRTFSAVAVKVEFRSRRVRAEETPAHEHARTGVRGDQPPPEIFHLMHAGEKRRRAERARNRHNLHSVPNHNQPRFYDAETITAQAKYIYKSTLIKIKSLHYFYKQAKIK